METKKETLPRRVKGTLTILEGDDMEFRAQRSTGVSTQELVSKKGDSKMYRTTGEKNPKMVAHLVTSADCPDPVADMREQLERLGKTLKPKAQPKLKGRVLLNDEGLRVVHNARQQQVEVVIDLSTAADDTLTNQLIRKLQIVSQCFAINKTSLNPPKS